MHTWTISLPESTAAVDVRRCWLLLLAVNAQHHSAPSTSHSFINAAALPVLFYSGPIFRPAGTKRYTYHGEIWQGGADHRSAPPCQISPWSVQGCGLTPEYAPKTLNMWNFANIISHKERVSCTTLTKFTGFMLILRIYKIAKFGCFISIKRYKQFTSVGQFQPNFRWP